MIVFRRYTNLASLIHILQTRSITLLNPATWDDRNDSYFMSEYKRLKKAQSVLALCFANKQETYHHWRVFSHGSDGVCIEFEKDKLLWSFEDEPKITQGFMKYRYITDLKLLKNLTIDDLPFQKRASYRDEGEYRVVYTDMDSIVQYKQFRIDLDCINKIVLSPWMAKTVASSIIKTLRLIPSCEEISITSSTLVDNERWKQFTAQFNEADDTHPGVRSNFMDEY